MKKILALTFALLLLVTSAYAATPDLANYSFEELLEIQRLLTAEIMNRDEWKEVAVPPGTYIVGTDIPAGIYTIEVRQASTNFWVYEQENGRTLINAGLYSTYEDLKQIKKLVLDAGNIVEINSSTVYFSPYTGLGF